MATNLENLNAALANVDAQLAAITATPKPTYSIDGKSVSWGEHFNNLIAAREKLIPLIIQAEGPTELHVTGTT